MGMHSEDKIADMLVDCSCIHIVEGVIRTRINRSMDPNVPLPSVHDRFIRDFPEVLERLNSL